MAQRPPTPIPLELPPDNRDPLTKPLSPIAERLVRDGVSRYLMSYIDDNYDVKIESDPEVYLEVLAALRRLDGNTNAASLPQMFLPPKEGRKKRSLTVLSPDSYIESRGDSPLAAYSAGAYRPSEDTIILRAGFGPASLIQTMVHEMNHSQPMLDEQMRQHMVKNRMASDYYDKFDAWKDQLSVMSDLSDHASVLPKGYPRGHPYSQRPWEELHVDLAARDALQPRGQRVWEEPGYEGYFQHPFAKEEYLNNMAPWMPQMRAAPEEKPFSLLDLWGQLNRPLY